MIGVGMMQAAVGWIGTEDALAEPEEVLAADSGLHIAGMPPTTAIALAVAVISAFIAYQQAPTDRAERQVERAETEITAPISIDEASSIVWRVVESDQG